MIIIIRKQNISMQVRSSEKRIETKHLLLPRAHLNKTSKVEFSDDKILRNCVLVEMRINVPCWEGSMKYVVLVSYFWISPGS